MAPRIFLRLLALAIAAAQAPPAAAQFFQDSFTLAIPTQSNFGSGPAYGVSQNFGASWSGTTDLGPGTSCPIRILGSCASGYYGWDFSMTSAGRVGLGLEAGVTGGTVAASLPESGLVAYLPGSGGSTPSTLFAVAGHNLNPSNASQVPQITLSGAGLSANVTGTLGASMSVEAEVCYVVGCSSGGGTVVPAFDTTFPIIGVNSANRNVLTLGGLAVPLPGVNKPTYINVTTGGGGGDPTSLTPYLQGDPLVSGVNIGQYQITTPKESTGGVATSRTSASFTAEQDVFSLEMSLPGIAQYLAETSLTGGAVNFDFLKNSYSIPGVLSARYNLFDVEAGLVLGMRQTARLETPIDVKLHFDKPVTGTYQVHIGESCTSSALGGFTGDCNDFTILAKCAIASVLGQPCIQVPVYETRTLASENGWLTVPSEAQMTADSQVVPISLSWDDNIPGQLDARLYELRTASLITTTELTIAPQIAISALCGSINLAGGVFSDSIPCAYQNTVRGEPLVFTVAADIRELTRDCATSYFSAGTAPLPFTCGDPPPDLATSNGAVPDDRLAEPPDLYLLAAQDPNDIVGGPDPNRMDVELVPEPASMMVMGLALVALSGFRRRIGR
jgi:hypothetical protein